MIKSGVIFGIVALALILLVTLISPFCGLCIGLVIGLAAGYVAGVFGKPISTRESLRMGAIAGVIAGAIGLVGQLIGGFLNSLAVNPVALEQLYQTFGLPNTVLSQSQITASQFLAAGCTGLFNILWMAVFGLAGGALWYQVVGKKQEMSIIPPQPPVTPS
jgi:hypothetical protein